MKVAINRCFGGFSISREAAEFMAGRGNKRAAAELADSPDRFYGYGYVEGFGGRYERNDPDLIAAVESLGKAASGRYAELAVVEIPDGIEYEIDEYDGLEHISEKHRTWA